MVEEQEIWEFPPAVSNRENSRGFTVPLNKRLVGTNQYLQDAAIKDIFAHLTESLQVADRLERKSFTRACLGRAEGR
jgi:SNW domain-containing protein 1